MLEYLCVAILVTFAFGSTGLYVYWYYKSDEDGNWPNKKK